MAADSGSPSSPEDSRWLLEPPRWGEIKIRLAIGRDAALTPEFREAVERLADAMAQAEVLARAGRLGREPGAEQPLPFVVRSERPPDGAALLIDFHVQPHRSQTGARRAPVQSSPRPPAGSPPGDADPERK